MTMSEVRRLAPRSRIVYKYIHHLNSVSTTLIVKHGVFYRLVKHRNTYVGMQKAVVSLDENKGFSRVAVIDIFKED